MEGEVKSAGDLSGLAPCSGSHPEGSNRTTLSRVGLDFFLQLARRRRAGSLIVRRRRPGRCQAMVVVGGKDAARWVGTTRRVNERTMAQSTALGRKVAG